VVSAKRHELRQAPPHPGVAARQLRRLWRERPRLALVLGSGFEHVLTGLESAARISYGRLRGFPPVGVSGHAGEVVLGKLGGTAVLVLSGRAHYYEGHSMAAITFPIRVLAEYGVRDVLLTNAAGGINRKFRQGDFMVIRDHLNLMGDNPLRGPTALGRERFVDLSRVYDPTLSALLRRAGREAGITVRSGVYLAVTGPSYETPSEIRAFERLGADAVGMSTVPEAIVARQCGLNVAGLSCITNLAAGRSHGPLSQTEVLRTLKREKKVATRMLLKFVKAYGFDQT
jgi:purine-nucleoside phosphorylase